MSTEWPAGYDRRILQTVDSTNAEAIRIARELSAPTWILALNQTAARGRRGRAWANPKGNFSATLVMRPEGAPDQAALRSFVASLALYDAFVAVTGRPEPFALKWPNDVLLNGGKVAGILLESVGSGQGISSLAIGFGVNLNEAPVAETLEKDAIRPVSLLSEAGVAPTQEAFLDILAPAYAHWEYQFTTYGFAPIRTVWLARAAKLGEAITARTTRETLHGTFETVDEGGNLVLKTATGRVAIPAADVFF